MRAPLPPTLTARITHARRGDVGGGSRHNHGALMDFVVPAYNNPMVRENINEIAAAWSDDEEQEVVAEDEVSARL